MQEGSLLLAKPWRLGYPKGRVGAERTADPKSDVRMVGGGGEWLINSPTPHWTSCGLQSS